MAVRALEWLAFVTGVTIMFNNSMNSIGVEKEAYDDALHLGKAGRGSSEGNSSNSAVLLTNFAELKRDALVAEWVEIHKKPPPLNLSRGLLLRAVAYQLQETEFGRLKKATRERLHKIAAGSNDSSDVSSNLNLGTRLLREWHGVAHEVVIEEAGVRYRGKLYRSLSEVAQVITGTKWSGPMFFGLRKRTK